MAKPTEPFPMFISLFACLCLAATISADCSVSIANAYYGDLKEPQPLILTENGNDFFYPNAGTLPKLALGTGKSVLIACPGSRNKIAHTNLKEAKATCDSGKNFIVNGVTRPFSTITCDTSPTISTKVLPQKCLGNKTAIAIGFQLAAKFLATIEVCRNDNTYETYYSKFQLSRKCKQAQSGYPRPTWQPGSHFNGMDVQKLYYWETQRSAIDRILGPNSPMSKLITRDTRLTRGHLAAKGDFVYGVQQNATFQYLNAAPQWGSFNSKNWEVLESSLRNFTARKSLDIEVYTGVHGEMTMPDIHGNQRVITISTARSKPMPVPRFFWKVIYHRASRKGTAFVGLNDPFIAYAPSNAYLCNNRIDGQITWLNWSANYTEGLSYACTVGDLSSRIPTIPRLNVVDVLI
ncbi:salivary endonuclease-like [Halictus rubicundus]|uniref:salivary endonuclease-like n=1 Tax=Halictus rubicundus TaxID=77578 RepID=UPI004034F732